MNRINVFHIIFVGPFLMFIGITKPKNDFIYNILLILGLLVCLKFMYLLITRKLSQSSVWYIIHVIMFSTIAIYVGLLKSKVPNIGYSLLVAIGVAAFGYHLIRSLGL